MENFSWRTKYLCNLFGFLSKAILSHIPFIYSFNNLFTYLWTPGCLFPTLGFSVILLYFIIQFFFSFGHWEIFQLSPMSLWYITINAGVGFVVFSTASPSIITRVPGLSCMFSKLFLQRLESFTENRIRNQDLGARCACATGANCF